jgi:GTP-binding protein
MTGIVFKDRVTVKISAGDGGDGCRAFRREKYVPRGGPNGGDGGKGGSVFLRGSKDHDSLVHLYYEPHQRAEHGEKGHGQQQTGRDGKDIYVPVPCGTVARDAETGDLVGEVLEDGETLLVARGGKGGLGNQHFATPSHRAPTETTPGEPGVNRSLVLEVKSIADAGLVGYPNAGKSTLLGALTNAKPKTGPYPFTTLHPIIGTLVFDDLTSLRIADVPGLIKDAYLGVGLGHDFLRHIERTRLLLFIIDMGGVDGRDPADDLQNLRRELKLYREELATRPCLVIANKMDEPGAEEKLAAFRARTGIDPLPVSAGLGEGIDRLREMLYDWRRGLRGFEPLPPAELPSSPSA